MSETQKKLWRSGGFAVDEWHTAETPDDRKDGDLIVPLALLQEAGDALLSRNSGRTGVRLEAGDDLSTLDPFIDRLSLVALSFPAFTDGRAYSKAVRLRQNYHFSGEIRAVGDVLIDQLAFMQRCGFDALEISHAVTLDKLDDSGVPKVSGHYQPALDDAAENTTYSWRRKSASTA